ncbi:MULTISPECIES: PixG protein [Providencia]|uniref:PixG protein n=1 Tax=Providencia manganoxydans TaxID=2923283 RepID=A0ABX7AF32_9GAMM|nr:MULTISPECIES: PixG protein [Providencia]MDX4947386.1 PixG protein [Providencia manganoxydans]QQO62558.1 PixG protein [Providencia manganoxydans]HEF8774743.1 PixG protein [Providencia stuartii]
MNKILVGLVLFSVTNSYAQNVSWQQNFLHIPSSGGFASATSSSLDVTDSNAGSLVRVTIPLVRSWLVVSSFCNPNPIPPGTAAAQGNYRYWIRFPQANVWQNDASGLRYYLSNISWSLAETNNNTNQVFVGPNYYGQQEPNTCWDVGFRWNLGSGTITLDRSMTLNVTVARANAYPGRYNLRIPFAWAYEENKGSSTSNAWDGFRQFGNVMSNYMNNYINVPVQITSKCNIVNRTINLSHGNMTPDSSINNVTSPYNYQLSCDYDASVSVSLIGSSQVSGKTQNYTRCGNGGTCELKYNGNAYNGTFKINAGTTRTLGITSTFHPNDVNNPVEGSFRGSAILRVLVN